MLNAPTLITVSPLQSLLRVFGITLACSGLMVLAAAFTRHATHFPRAYLLAMMAGGVLLALVGSLIVLLNRVGQTTGTAPTPRRRTRGKPAQ